MTITERLKAMIASLDRICPACMAATSDEISERLHAGKWCATRAEIAIAPEDAFNFVRGMHLSTGPSPTGWRRLVWWRRRRFEVLLVRHGTDATITLRDLRWSWLRWKWIPKDCA